jgi:HK97 family phage prohead protease
MSTRSRLVTRNRKVEVSKRADGQSVIAGYAAVFFNSADHGTEYNLWSNIYERINPAAFNRAIQERQDTVGLFNHDDNYLLGRVANGTLSLSVDSIGLRYEITVNDQDDDHKRVMAKIERGDLRGSSFSFVPTSVTYMTEGDKEVREIMDCDLYDVCPVTMPAYEATTTALRSDQQRAEIEQEIAAEKAKANAPSAVAIRLRMLELQAQNEQQ